MASGNVLLIFFMLATLAVLTVGIVLMMRGGKLNQTYGNKLMSLRVVLQACALVVLAVLYLASQS